MENAINSITTKLDDLQYKLQKYKVNQTDIIIEDDVENSNRKVGELSFRSGVKKEEEEIVYERLSSVSSDSKFWY